MHRSGRSEWRCLVRLADAPLPSGMVRVVVGDLAICLVHADDGRFYAVEDRCSHEDYPLSEGELDGYTVECPRHGSRFDIRTGEVLNLPAILPVRAFHVDLINEEVVGDLETN